MRMAYPNELMHYGVLGMKWGVRRYQYADGTLTAAGRARYGRTVQRGLDVASGTKQINRMTAAVIRSRKGQKDKTTGFRMRTNTNDSPERDLVNVNPLRTKYGMKGTSLNENCGNCSIAFEMRMRGYDVMASTINGLHLTYKNIMDCFPGGIFKSATNAYDAYPDDKSRFEQGEMIGIHMDRNRIMAKALAVAGANYDVAKETINNMSKEPDSRGVVAVQWGSGGAHAMAYTVKNGEVTFYCGQTGKAYTGTKLIEELAFTWETAYYRTDDKAFNLKKIKEVTL